MAQALAFDNRSGQTIRAAQISLRTGHIAIQQGISHSRRTHAFTLVEHNRKHGCRKFREGCGNGFVVTLAAGAKAMVVAKEHGTHAAFFNQLLTDKDIEREFRHLGRKREH